MTTWKVSHMALLCISSVISESDNFFHIYTFLCLLSIACSYPLPIFLNCLFFSWFVGDLYIFCSLYKSMCCKYLLSVDFLYIVFWFRDVLDSNAVEFINRFFYGSTFHAPPQLAIINTSFKHYENTLKF